MAWPFAGFFSGLFGGSLPRIDAPTGGTADTTLSLNNPIGSVVRSCLDRIISRACYVIFDGDSDLPNRPTGEWGARAFYTKVMEQMMVEGSALCYPVSPHAKGGPYKVAITGGSTYNYSDNTWTLKTSYIDSGKGIRVPAHRVLYITYRPQHGDRVYMSESPLFEIADAMILYEQARSQWIDYANRGHRIGFVIQGNKEVVNPDSRKNAIDEVRNFLNGNKRSYGVITLPLEAQMAALSHPPAPVKEAILLATQEVARFYGVPLQMLQTEVAPQGAEELAESKLLSDAVFPICERIAQGWEMHLKRKVNFKPMMLSRPTLGARASYIASLAGTGCVTIDECRGLVDYPPLPDGEGKLMPSPRGGSTQGLAEEERKGAPNKSGANKK